MIGRTLSHYRLIAELGAGGMGVVYKARDEKLPRFVAVKVLRPEYAQREESRERFLRETRAFAAVKHSYIAAIHDAGEQDAVLFIAMEYVEGSTMRDLIRNGPYPVRDALHRGCEIAEGLAHVHATGIIHRDLKPGNIMVSADGHAKILDFGLAKLHEERDEETSTLLTSPLDETRQSTRVGTPAYMSPEQVRRRTVDHRSDVFAFGSTMFEILTGQSLFGRRGHNETLSAIVHENAIPASTLNAEVPQELDWILEKCLAKEPRDRYQDTRDLVVDLDRLRWKWETGSVGRHDSISVVKTITIPDHASQPAPVAAGVGPEVPTTGTSRPSQSGSGKRLRRVWPLALASVVLGVLLVFLVWRPWRERVFPPSRTFYARGLYYMREESESPTSVDNAIHMFNRALTADSTVANTWAALGEAHWIQFQLTKEPAHKEEATAAVSRALALDPENAEALNAQGRGYLAQAKYADARDVLQRAVERDKKHDFAWANLGRAHQGLRNYAAGLQAIQRAIALNPQSFRHRLTLGTFYRDFQEKEAAIGAYRQATELKPNSNYAWNNLGSVLLQTGAYEEAAEAFEKSIAIVDNATARSNLGTAYLFMGKYEDAERQYRRAIEIAPGDLVHYENLIDALIKLGRQAEIREISLTALERAYALVQAVPSDAKAHMRLATLCARAGRTDCAVAEAARATELEPQSVQILFRRAKLHCILAQVVPALDFLESAAKYGLSKAEIVNDPDLEILHDEPRYQRILVLAE